MGGFPSHDAASFIYTTSVQFPLYGGPTDICLVPLLRRYFNDNNRRLKESMVEVYQKGIDDASAPRGGGAGGEASQGLNGAAASCTSQPRSARSSSAQGVADGKDNNNNNNNATFASIASTEVDMNSIGDCGNPRQDQTLGSKGLDMLLGEIEASFFANTRLIFDSVELAQVCADIVQSTRDSAARPEAVKGDVRRPTTAHLRSVKEALMAKAYAATVATSGIIRDDHRGTGQGGPQWPVMRPIPCAVCVIDHEYTTRRGGAMNSSTNSSRGESAAAGLYSPTTSEVRSLPGQRPLEWVQLHGRRLHCIGYISCFSDHTQAMNAQRLRGMGDVAGVNSTGAMRGAYAPSGIVPVSTSPHVVKVPRLQDCPEGGYDVYLELVLEKDEFVSYLLEPIMLLACMTFRSQFMNCSMWHRASTSRDVEELYYNHLQLLNVHITLPKDRYTELRAFYNQYPLLELIEEMGIRRVNRKAAADVNTTTTTTTTTGTAAGNNGNNNNTSMSSEGDSSGSAAPAQSAAMNASATSGHSSGGEAASAETNSNKKDRPGEGCDKQDEVNTGSQGNARKEDMVSQLIDRIRRRIRKPRALSDQEAIYRNTLCRLPSFSLYELHTGESGVEVVLEGGLLARFMKYVTETAAFETVKGNYIRCDLGPLLKERRQILHLYRDTVKEGNEQANENRRLYGNVLVSKSVEAWVRAGRAEQERRRQAFLKSATAATLTPVAAPPAAPVAPHPSPHGPNPPPPPLPISSLHPHGAAAVTPANQTMMLVPGVGYVASFAGVPPPPPPPPPPPMLPHVPPTTAPPTSAPAAAATTVPSAPMPLQTTQQPAQTPTQTTSVSSPPPPPPPLTMPAHEDVATNAATTTVAASHNTAILPPPPPPTPPAPLAPVPLQTQPLSSQQQQASADLQAVSQPLTTQQQQQQQQPPVVQQQQQVAQLQQTKIPSQQQPTQGHQESAAAPQSHPPPPHPPAQQQHAPPPPPPPPPQQSQAQPPQVPPPQPQPQQAFAPQYMQLPQHANAISFTMPQAYAAQMQQGQGQFMPHPSAPAQTPQQAQYVYNPAAGQVQLVLTSNPAAALGGPMAAPGLYAAAPMSLAQAPHALPPPPLQAQPQPQTAQPQYVQQLFYPSQTGATQLQASSIPGYAPAGATVQTVQYQYAINANGQTVLVPVVTQQLAQPQAQPQTVSQPQLVPPQYYMNGFVMSQQGQQPQSQQSTQAQPQGVQGVQTMTMQQAVAAYYAAAQQQQQQQAQQPAYQQQPPPSFQQAQQQLLQQQLLQQQLQQQQQQQQQQAYPLPPPPPPPPSSHERSSLNVSQTSHPGVKLAGVDGMTTNASGSPLPPPPPFPQSQVVRHSQEATAPPPPPPAQQHQAAQQQQHQATQQQALPPQQQHQQSTQQQRGQHHQQQQQPPALVGSQDNHAVGAVNDKADDSTSGSRGPLNSNSSPFQYAEGEDDEDDTSAALAAATAAMAALNDQNDFDDLDKNDDDEYYNQNNFLFS